MCENCNHTFVSTLDDIAWTLNIRGSDFKYTPLFFSYMIFFKGAEAGSHRCELFANSEKFSDEVIEYLK
jgi:Xaa-Pro aminopeptidase